MKFVPHYDLVDKHAFLSPSQHAWSNYSDEKLLARYTTRMAAQRGTELHALAHDLIRLGVKLPRTPKTLNLYVNDAIGWKMQPEVVLYHSEEAFGTVDAISFRKKLLRISDLKTGVSPASVRQLEIYAALFCLEYGFKPVEIDMELRIYQHDTVTVYEGDYDVVTHIMSKIVTFDKLIAARKIEMLG